MNYKMSHHFSDLTRAKHLLFPFARRACSPTTSILEQPENDLVSTLSLSLGILGVQSI